MLLKSLGITVLLISLIVGAIGLIYIYPYLLIVIWLIIVGCAIWSFVYMILSDAEKR